MKPVCFSIAGAVAALGLMAAATDASAGARPALIVHDSEEAAPQLIFDLYTPSHPVQLERAQYSWGGRRYCWYDGGWRGAGWYWCGYAQRRGFGWGGPGGWRGWSYHRPVGRGFRGGGYHGGGHAYHGGGYHGGGHGGGGHSGGGHGGGGHGGGHDGGHHH